MVGTLWKSESGILVCTKYEDGYIYMIYLDLPDCAACSHESTIHTYYTQLTQPKEDICKISTQSSE
jgi:hypothetical protein